MRDRTKARNYSPAAEEFRREHKRHRDWGLAQRHGRRLRQLRDRDRRRAEAIEDHRQPLPAEPSQRLLRPARSTSPGSQPDRPEIRSGYPSPAGVSCEPAPDQATTTPSTETTDPATPPTTGEQPAPTPAQRDHKVPHPDSTHPPAASDRSLAPATTASHPPSPTRPGKEQRADPRQMGHSSSTQSTSTICRSHPKIRHFRTIAEIRTLLEYDKKEEAAARGSPLPMIGGRHTQQRELAARLGSHLTVN
jgi:hypothetical protein